MERMNGLKVSAMNARICINEKGSRRDFRQFLVSVTESPFNLAAGFDVFF